ncbi:MAG: protoporphyrinogen oxidase HemJ [Deltaproteobacteria bacterium]|nr:protoporphyrinogen oxidase HemJ [Deltaproteobacteria bacterium]
MAYLTYKWLHIVSVISWMAGLLYLYRLFVYHSDWGKKSSDNHDMLLVMEKRLLHFITLPAMLVAWVAGISLIVLNPDLMKAGWMHSKLLLVVILTGVTHWGIRLHKNYKNGKASYSSKTLRFVNEIPTILMLVIVALVIFRPF